MYNYINCFDLKEMEVSLVADIDKSDLRYGIHFSGCVPLFQRGY